MASSLVDMTASVYYDAEEFRATRRYTDFPEASAAEAIGPWRATEVDACTVSPWLLIGRRHSVDERRDDMEKSKALFLRTLAAKADGVWRQRTAARAEELQSTEEQISATLRRQARTLKATRDFWVARHKADCEYLGQLDTSHPGLPQSHARHVLSWRDGVRSAKDLSGSWASSLPHAIRQHDDASITIHRTVASAVTAVDTASRLVREARNAVWPAGVAATAKLPGSHTGDAGPEGVCLWLAVRRYIAACNGLQQAQSIALARVHRQKHRTACLAQWVDQVLGCPAGGTAGAPAVSSPLPPVDADAPEETVEPVNLEDFSSAESSNGEDEGTLDMSMDASPLVVHEQEVEVWQNVVAKDMDDYGGGGDWIPSRLLLSMDLWLHLWTPTDLPPESAPAVSLPLPSACLQPVAERSHTDGRVLCFTFRPHTAPSLLKRFSAILQTAYEAPPPQELRIRCADEAACAALYEALELVEKLYPIAL